MTLGRRVLPDDTAARGRNTSRMPFQVNAKTPSAEKVALSYKPAFQLMRLEQEFGMAPWARSRVQVDKPAPHDLNDPTLKYRSPNRVG